MFEGMGVNGDSAGTGRSAWEREKAAAFLESAGWSRPCASGGSTEAVAVGEVEGMEEWGEGADDGANTSQR